MCYHKSLNVKASELEERYEAKLPDSADFQPVYHANAYQFPTWPILTLQDPNRFQMMRWGLVPHWARSRDNADEIRSKTLNARSETIYEKPSFRSSAQEGKRCLIPVTGFFEWFTKGSKKFPFYINTSDQKIASIAGLWDEWPDPETGELITTYTLLTTDANPLLAAIHNTKKRMPCVLTPDAEHAWLHDDLSESDALKLLDKQYPANHMHSYSISKRITSRSEPSDVPDVLKPADYPELSKNTQLFA
ncbi:SOS response-associated peptidase [Spirosoma endophyticum]|uniref:Abasic site processing protein n=1 Tax=Spirosoma endophyticum TaxID=662367 RepID=A0A1I1N0I0_9BACT|nr:SOS response-associated peptidase [Spirosoma endophyticum]SFC91151.1 Putative SOS response-associated peptidase YedK [Spirosoma endophyticum]